MGFFDKVQDGLNEGLSVSRDLLKKAKDKATDLGEIGILKYEVAQLENMSEKLASRLGVAVYQALRENGQNTVSAGTTGVRDVLDEIDEVRRKLELKQEKISELQRNKNHPGS